MVTALVIGLAIASSSVVGGGGCGRSRRLSALPIALALILYVSPAMAEVTARLDRQQVVEGETVTLVLETSETRQSLDTSLEVLAADFHVIDQRTETRMSIVGGRQQAEKRLLITLEPKRVGALTIPALTFAGGVRTAPLTLSVTAAPSLAPGELPPVFIETEVEPGAGPYYVHAQLSFKVRIFYQQNLTEAAINPPAPKQASVRLLDEVPYQAERNGRRFRVLERRYAVFPERSGQLLIPPMELTGRLIERRSDRLWQPSTRGRRVRVESEPVRLEVAPRPDTFQGDSWLPARSLDLAQQISDGESVRVGEPVTRTLLVDAVGLEEHMLDEPSWPELPGARVYPDQPTGISRDDGQWVLGHREFRYAVVPERPGQLTLPELSVSWWDTVNDRQRVAKVPSHTVTVLPSELTGLAPPPDPPESGGSATGEVLGGASGLRAWQGAALVFAVLWLATLLLYLRRAREPRSAGEKDDPLRGPDGEQELLDRFRRACREQDAPSARASLGRWLRAYGPPQARGSVAAFADMVDDPGLADGLRQLATAGFDPGSDDRAAASVPGPSPRLAAGLDGWLRRGRGDGSAQTPRFDLYAR